MRNVAPEITRQRVIVELRTHMNVGPEEITGYLLGLVEVTSMERLSWPHTYSAHELGWAGYLHWRTSGSAVYSYPLSPELVTVDCYTCKPFDVRRMVEYTRAFFDAIDLVYEEVTR